MKLGFAGSPAFAVEVLNRLVHHSQHEVLRILTQPRKPAGRGRSIVDSPVGARARQLGIPYLTPADKWANRNGLWVDLDVVVVAAYGQIIRAEALKEPRFGWLNVHPSLLPRWRGATPIEHAILAGDAETGVCIMQITEGLDEGPIFREERIPLSGEETARHLSHSLAIRGARLLIQVLDGIENGSEPQPCAQTSEGVTYARRLKPEDARINWIQEALQIERQVRAFDDRGGAFTTAGTLRMKIHDAITVSGQFPPGQFTGDGANLVLGCGIGGLLLRTVRLNRGSGKILPFRDATNGYPKVFSPGFQFDVTL